MIIFPAIDFFSGKAVRLYHGDYDRMTVYSDTPEDVAADFARQGATHIHMVDLEGARSGGTPNFDAIRRIKEKSGLFCEVGGGIRSIDVIERYIGAGIDRVILGTAAVSDETFVRDAVSRYGEHIAVSVDMRDGFVAVKGWTESSGVEAFDFCRRMKALGVCTLIVTDISKDGALGGTNLPLYSRLSREFSINITASGGVSTLDDVMRLASMNIYGAIIGRAYYTGDIILAEAIEAAR